MQAIKKTLMKYFISSDGAISVGSIGIALSTLLLVISKTIELWPLSPSDLTTIATMFTSGGAFVGIYRGLKK